MLPPIERLLEWRLVVTFIFNSPKIIFAFSLYSRFICNLPRIVFSLTGCVRFCNKDLQGLPPECLVGVAAVPLVTEAGVGPKDLRLALFLDWWESVIDGMPALASGPHVPLLLLLRPTSYSSSSASSSSSTPLPDLLSPSVLSAFLCLLSSYLLSFSCLSLSMSLSPSCLFPLPIPLLCTFKKIEKCWKLWKLVKKLWF